MYWLVESIDQLKNFYSLGYKEAFIEVIPFNDNIHPTQNSISLLYIRPILATKGFMLGIDHSETLNEIAPHFNAILKKFDILYCRDKKEILHYLPIKQLYDITPPPHPYIRPSTPTHDLFYRNHESNPEVNKIIPIVKHYEICEQIYNDLKSNIDREKTEYDEFFNNKVSLVFNAIERNGIHINRDVFEKHFHEVENDFVYTQYNLKTTTTRPSNKFNGVNYAALNKENSCRKSFIPRNDIFVEFDISAYHINLASRLINYSFPVDDIHDYFAALYNVDYAKAKELTFKQLYGGVFEIYKDLDFFKKIQIYIETNWNQFEKQGYIKVPISGYRIEKNNVENMNPQKLFNYLLQGYETSQNILVLWDILRILKNKNTKLILYTYDSFLLDVDKNENVIEEIKQVFNKYKLNVKEKTGYDYDFGKSN